MDLLIAHMISGWEMIPYEWHKNFSEVQIPPNIKAIRAKFPEPCIDISRDKAVQLAIQSGAKWIFFHDTDLLIPTDTIERLIAHDKPIVGGLYVRRHQPPFNEMLRFRTDGIQGLNPIQAGQFVPGSLVECDAIATGCMLIKTDIFEKIKPFSIVIDGIQAKPAWFLWTEWRLGLGFSEDFQFCVRARQCGIPIYCDTSIVCKHVGPVKHIPTPEGGAGIEFLGA